MLMARCDALRCLSSGSSSSLPLCTPAGAWKFCFDPREHYSLGLRAHQRT